MGTEVKVLIKNCLSSKGSDYDIAKLLDTLLSSNDISEKHDIKFLSNFMSTIVHDSIVDYMKERCMEQIKDYSYSDSDIADKLLQRVKTRKAKDEIIKEFKICFS